MEACLLAGVKHANARHSMHMRRWFFISIAAAGTMLTFAGFAPTYYLKTLFDTAALPLRVHAHGILFTAWVVLFLTQTALVATRRTDLHRRLGLLGILLVMPMLVSGLMVAIVWARIDSPVTAAALTSESRLKVLVIPLTSVVLFALLAAIGLYHRQRPDVHKRLMLLATLALLPPALGRIPILAAGGPAAFFAVTTGFIIAAVIYDYVTTGRLHPVSLWGGGVLAASFPGRLALGDTEAWTVFAQWLIGG